MRNYGKWIGASAIVMASLTTVAGCADRNNNGQPDDAATSGEVANSVDSAGDSASNAASNAANAVSDAGQNLDNAANNAVAATSNAVGKAGTAIKGALNTADVKSAILANASLNNPKNQIDVTTKDNQVILSGKVQNQQQKKLAGDIATKNAQGYKLVNNLKAAK